MAIETVENKLALLNKIQAIIQEIGGLPKDGYNEKANFRFTTHVTINNKLKELYEKHCILILPEVIESNEVMLGSNGTAFRSCVKMEFEVFDLETGFSIIKKFEGGDQDYMGKSLSQAITECQKRWEIKTFKISSIEESDPDGNHGTEGDYMNYRSQLNAIEARFTQADKSFAQPVISTGYNMSNAFNIYQKDEFERVVLELESKLK